MSVTEKEVILDYNNSLNDIVSKFLSISHEIKELFQQTIASHFAADEGDSRLLSGYGLRSYHLMKLKK